MHATRIHHLALKTHAVERRAPISAAAGTAVEIAHVLFMDLAGYSKLFLEDQARYVEELTRVVIHTPEYQEAAERHQLITESTGDGMVLIFFGDPIQPVRCAVSVARALRRLPHLRLRMGVHSGPVLRFTDSRGAQGLVGSGVNMGQRVMDSASEGQILLSEFTASILSGMGQWAEWVEDLGTFEVKHGVQLRLFNLCDGQVGVRREPRAKRPRGAAWTGLRHRLAGLASLLIAALGLKG
jgi:class 3 adenylate cyclase